MDIFARAQRDLTAVIANFAGDDFQSVASKLRFSLPPAHLDADYATNAAMVLAGALHRPPQAIAADLAEKFTALPFVQSAAPAGAYVNISFTPAAWADFFAGVITAGRRFGAPAVPPPDADPAAPADILLEFISANPTGPLHIGHTRGAVLGLALARLLTKAGYRVTTEYYVNDYGVQIRTLLRSLQFRYQQACGRHQGQNVPEGCYPGDYLLPLAAAWHDQYGDQFADLDEDSFFARFKDEAVASMLDQIRADLTLLGLEFDRFTSETALVEQGSVRQALAQLASQTCPVTDEDGITRQLPCLYQGELQAPLGGPANEAEEEKSRHDDGLQTIFRSTAYGDDRDRVVARSDGTTTYFASDIAYHFDKIHRGYPVLLNLFGADHGGYVARLQAAVSALSSGRTHLEVQLMQLVSLERDGQPYKMSKRAGNFLLLRDVLAQVDVDELKLFILTKSANTPMTFDLVRVRERSRDNPVYYIQYAATRTYSLSRQYRKLFGEDYQFQAADTALLITDSDELTVLRPLARALARYPGVIALSARERAPYILVTYLYELAAAFHALWSQPRKLLDTADPAHSRLMMAAATATQTVLVDALACLGVAAKREM